MAVQNEFVMILEWKSTPYADVIRKQIWERMFPRDYLLYDVKRITTGDFESAFKGETKCSWAIKSDDLLTSSNAIY